MSAFSDTLSQYISDKNVKVYSMAKYCDTEPLQHVEIYQWKA